MTDTTQEHGQHHVAHDAARTIRFVIVAALILAVVLVALDNTSKVRLGYVFGDADAPVWLAIAASAVAGSIIGWAATHRPRRSR
ncbi:MAG: hypothetical protein JWN99_1098 [Ilumatobacteraceae bacterium]|nr:hypothetical protein [Ilumatobacteraceae bacterium]